MSAFIANDNLKPRKVYIKISRFGFTDNQLPESAIFAATLQQFHLPKKIVILQYICNLSDNINIFVPGILNKSTKIYGKFRLSRKEFTGFVGPSCSGKTSLL